MSSKEHNAFYDEWILIIQFLENVEMYNKYL